MIFNNDYNYGVAYRIPVAKSQGQIMNWIENSSFLKVGMRRKAPLEKEAIDACSNFLCQILESSQDF
jgi:hypothetical protein